MTCTVSGNLIDLQEQPQNAVRLTISPVIRTFGRADGSTTLPNEVVVATDASGDVEVELMPGQYVIKAEGGRRPSTKITVPDAPTANLADIMDLAPPAALSDAEAAELAAQGYASKAYTYANAPVDQELPEGGYSGFHWFTKNTEIAGQITSLEQTIAGHVQSVNEDRAAIVTLEQTIAGHVQSVDDDRAVIVQLEQTISGTEQTIAGHVQSVNDDLAAVASLEQTIAGHVQSVDEDRAAIVTLETQIAGHAQTASDKAQEATDARDAILLPLLQSATAHAQTNTLILQLHAAQQGA